MKKVLNIVFSLAVLAAGFLVYDNRYQIIDWYRLRDYTPPESIAQLAEKSSMNEDSKKIFYARYPELLDKQNFNANCTIHESGLVLGCYNGIDIYILDITEPKLEGVEVVTAAHEMLHVAYDRLSSSEKQRINDLLWALYTETDDQRISEIVDQYDTSDRELLLNELHSILPTELYDLGSELEEYYSRYFDNRKEVVDLAKSYEKVFTDLEDRANKLQEDINRLETLINDQKSYLDSLYNQLQAQKADLDARRSGVNNTNYQQYNRDVNQYNADVKEYNDAVAYANSLISQYEKLIDEYNSTALTRNTYIKNIDSKYQSIE